MLLWRAGVQSVGNKEISPAGGAVAGSMDYMGMRLLGSSCSRGIRIHVLLHLRCNYFSRSGRIFGGAFIVEKNMLWYNQFMGKKRRSREFRNNSQVIDMDEARKKRLEKRREEKAREEENARQRARQNTKGKMAIRRQKNRRRLLTGLIVVCIIAVVGFSVINIISLKKEQHDVLAQQEQLEKEKKQLQKALDNINDPENLEEQARNQLRLIKPGETLYMFPDEITDRTGSTDEDKEDQD